MEPEFEGSIHLLEGHLFLLSVTFYTFSLIHAVSFILWSKTLNAALLLACVFKDASVDVLTTFFFFLILFSYNC